VFLFLSQGNFHQSSQFPLVDLYLNVKIRKQEEIENFDENSLEKERETLKALDPIQLIEYIKASIEILINLKVEEKIQAHKENKDDQQINMNNFFNEDEEGVNEYERLLRQLEAEIRNHIKIEHQLKLHSDTLQARVEELEQIKEELKVKNKKK